MNDTTQTPTLTIPKEIYLTLMEALDELEDAYRPDAQSVNARLWLQTYASQRPVKAEAKGEERSC